MIEQVCLIELIQLIKRINLKVEKKLLNRIWFTLGLIFFLITVLKQSWFSLPQNNSPSDLSIYFTGNVRGNLEPCG